MTDKLHKTVEEFFDEQTAEKGLSDEALTIMRNIIQAKLGGRIFSLDESELNQEEREDIEDLVDFCIKERDLVECLAKGAEGRDEVLKAEEAEREIPLKQSSVETPTKIPTLEDLDNRRIRGNYFGKMGKWDSDFDLGAA